MLTWTSTRIVVMTGVEDHTGYLYSIFNEDKSTGERHWVADFINEPDANEYIQWRSTRGY